MKKYHVVWDIDHDCGGFTCCTLEEAIARALDVYRGWMDSAEGDFPGDDDAWNEMINACYAEIYEVPEGWQDGDDMPDYAVWPTDRDLGDIGWGERL